MLAKKKENGADVGKLRWALRVNQTQPELVVFKGPHIWIFRIVDDLIANRCNTEHHTRMSDAAIKEHVEFDQTVESWIADHFASRRTSRLIIEHHNVRSDDVNIWISRQEADLNFYALGYTDVISVHPCDEFSVHVKSNLHACV